MLLDQKSDMMDIDSKLESARLFEKEGQYEVTVTAVDVKPVDEGNSGRKLLLWIIVNIVATIGIVSHDLHVALGLRLLTWIM